MDDDLRWHDATAVADLVRTGEVSPAEVIEAAIGRIEQDNPALNAVITPLFDKARTAARADEHRGPFRGVPFLLKDAVCHSAGDPFHMGMQLLKDAGYVAPDDTWLAQRFRQSGLITLGKTNAPEYATSATTEPLAYGPTHNPWDLNRSPGGSSGGSAAAVAAGLVPVAHANDMGGSIRIPAGWCGLVGLKPTRGRTTLGPHWGEYWAMLTHEHVVCRTMRDTAGVLDAIHGAAIGDPYTAPSPRRPFVAELTAGTGPLRIGVRTHRPDTGAVAQDDCVRAVDAVAAQLAELGHRVEFDALPELDGPGGEGGAGLGVVIAAFMAFDMDLWAERLGRRIEPEDLEPMNGAMLERGRSLSAKEYVAALSGLQAYGRRIARWTERFELLVMPTSSSPPKPLGVNSPVPDTTHPDFDLGGPASFTLPFDISGEPAMSLPLGWTADNLPVGVQLVAPFGREDLLLSVGGALELTMPWSARHPPRP